MIAGWLDEDDARGGGRVTRLEQALRGVYPGIDGAGLERIARSLGDPRTRAGDLAIARMVRAEHLEQSWTETAASEAQGGACAGAD